MRHEEAKRLIAASPASRLREQQASYEVFTKPGLGQLQVLCESLNREPNAPFNPEVRRLISAWQQSGPNIQAMFRAEPELKRALESDVRPVFLPTESGSVHVYFEPTACIQTQADGSRRVYFDLSTPEATLSVARSLFITIPLSPFWERFGGPCPWCRRYFVRKTAKQSIYCTRKCASQHSAIEATIRAREEKRKEKLERAQRAIAEWEKLKNKRRTNKPWKEWVSTYDPQFTGHFLTRAVNSGDLRSPADAKGLHDEKSND